MRALWHPGVSGEDVADGAMALPLGDLPGNGAGESRFSGRRWARRASGRGSRRLSWFSAGWRGPGGRGRQARDEDLEQGRGEGKVGARSGWSRGKP